VHPKEVTIELSRGCPVDSGAAINLIDGRLVEADVLVGTEDMTVKG